MLALILNVDCAEINFIDRDRQWSKSRYGGTVRQIPREHSLCAHTIFQDDVMIVPDTRTDSRFRDNPYVNDPPEVRFYMGVPLCSRNGHAVGTLCVFDDTPRSPANNEIQTLKNYGEITENELRRRRTDREQLPRNTRADFHKHLQHRVNNTLQLVLSFLNLERRVNPDRTIEDRHYTLRSRIQMFGLLQKHLADDDELRVKMKRVVDDLIEGKLRDYPDRITDDVDRTSRVDDITVTMNRATVLTVMVNELIDNALRHAFSPSKPGKLHVALHKNRSRIRLQVEDNGPGIPDSRQQNTGTTGIRLLQKLCAHLGAELHFDTSNGTTATVRIPR